jgi:hypothetical protein
MWKAIREVRQTPNWKRSVFQRSPDPESFPTDLLLMSNLRSLIARNASACMLHRKCVPTWRRRFSEDSCDQNFSEPSVQRLLRTRPSKKAHARASRPRHGDCYRYTSPEAITRLRDATEAACHQHDASLQVLVPQRRNAHALSPSVDSTGVLTIIADLWSRPMRAAAVPCS